MIYLTQENRGRQKVWFVHQVGEMPAAFVRLVDAKAFALRIGASGKWERSEPAGPRGRKIIRYDDAKAGER